MLRLPVTSSALGRARRPLLRQRLLRVATPTMTVDKQKSLFSSWSVYQKRNNPAMTFETSILCYMLLLQFAQKRSVPINTETFVIGSSRNCNFPLDDQSVNRHL